MLLFDLNHRAEDEGDAIQIYRPDLVMIGGMKVTGSGMVNTLLLTFVFAITLPRSFGLTIDEPNCSTSELSTATRQLRMMK